MSNLLKKKLNSVTGSAAFKHRDYRCFWLARLLGVLAIEMQITAISWQVYQLTGEALDLGLVGLAQFLPFLVLFLVSGSVADRFKRTHIMSICVILQTVCGIIFFVLTINGKINFLTIFIILIFVGIARAFQSPAQSAIVPLLVPKEHVANAIAWTSSGFQMSRIAGPGIAGIMIISGEELVYATSIILFILSTIFTLLIKTNTQTISKTPINLKNIFNGLEFVLKRQILVGAIGLDLFAVLLGGATALLPIFATDILNVGSTGFGALRATHMIGALSGALILTQYPITRFAGKSLLLSVGTFGLAIIIFGLSTYFWLSIAALFVIGSADSVSVFIRNNLVQIITPDHMRGRVSAVSAVFIGASNELGELESGVTAHFWGTVPAVVIGGIGTIIIAGLFAYRLPELRGVNSLDPDDLIKKYQNLGP